MADLLDIAYLDDGDDDIRGRFRTLNEMDRTSGAFDGEELVGSVSAFSFDVAVPGHRSLPMAGTTIVAVKPTHRRRGLLRLLMAAHLDDVRSRREPLAGLWASEAQIYGRFGYGWATDMVSVEIDSDLAQITGEIDETITFRMVSRDEFLAVAPDLFERLGPRQPGAISRTADWWKLRRTSDGPMDRLEMSTQRYVLARRHDDVVGYYRTKDEYADGKSTGTVKVGEVIGVDLDAELATWNFLFGIDLTTKITTRPRPSDDPLVHRLVDSRRYARKVIDSLYLRIMDIPTALGGRGYEYGGSLGIEITDQDTAGVYRLTVDDSGEATCEVGGTPDVTMDARTLGAVYLGGRRIQTMAQAGRV